MIISSFNNNRLFILHQNGGANMKTIIAMFVILASFNFLPINSAYAYTTDKDVDEFARDWFLAFDHNDKTEVFLNKIFDANLEMSFPEAQIHSHKEFRAWYKGVLATIASATHQVNSIKVLWREQNQIGVEVLVFWKAKTLEGKEVSFKAKQLWTLVEENGGLKIKKYIVSEDKDKSLSCVCYGGAGNYQYSCAPIVKTCYGGPGNYPYECTVCR